jgi:hypothetical protein
VADYFCGALALKPAVGAMAAAVAALDEALDVVVEAAGGAAGALEGELPAGAGGRGAETPAMSEPRPSFCKLGASIFPVGSIPFDDWNFCMAATVLESHLPLGSPW